jgi:hypothetical protein
MVIGTKRCLHLAIVLMALLLVCCTAALGAAKVTIDFSDQSTLQQIANHMGVAWPLAYPVVMLDPSMPIAIQTSEGVVSITVIDGELGIGDVNGDGIGELWIPSTVFDVTFEWGAIANISGVATDFCDSITITAWKDIAKTGFPANTITAGTPTPTNPWVNVLMVLPPCELLEFSGVESAIKYLTFELY